jgi:hypothetical protein
MVRSFLAPSVEEHVAHETQARHDQKVVHPRPPCPQVIAGDDLLSTARIIHRHSQPRHFKEKRRISHNPVRRLDADGRGMAIAPGAAPGAAII